MASAFSANHRKPWAHLTTSPLAWAKGLPISSVTVWAMSGTSPSSSSAAVTSSRDRSSKVLCAHRSAPAAAVASRASSATASNGSKDSRSSPVAGLTEAMGGPEAAACMPSSIAHPHDPAPPLDSPGPGGQPVPSIPGSARRRTFPVEVRGSWSTTSYLFGRL